MAKPKRERELSTRRVTEHRGAFRGQLDSETRTSPSADVLDEELLVCRESFRVEDGRVLVEPRHLLGQPVDADDHRGRDIGRLEEPTPSREPLSVTREDDCLGRIRRDVRRDLATTVVSEQRLGDELSRERGGARRFRAGRLIAQRG